MALDIEALGASVKTEELKVDTLNIEELRAHLETHASDKKVKTLTLAELHEICKKLLPQN